MFEATTNPRARSAIEAAHTERSRALAAVWAWLFDSTSR